MQQSDESEKDGGRIAAVIRRVSDDSEKSSGGFRLCQKVLSVLSDPSLPFVSTDFAIAICVGDVLKLRRQMDKTITRNASFQLELSKKVLKRLISRRRAMVTGQWLNEDLQPRGRAFESRRRILDFKCKISLCCLFLFHQTSVLVDYVICIITTAHIQHCKHR